MSELTLTRAERLRSLKMVRRLFEEGRSGFIYPFRYMWLLDELTAEEDSNVAVKVGTEVLFSVPKRFLKRANKRNLVRRRTKEAYRLGKAAMTSKVGNRHLSIALVYSTKKIHEYKTINNAVERILAEISSNL